MSFIQWTSFLWKAERFEKYKRGQITLTGGKRVTMEKYVWKLTQNWLHCSNDSDKNGRNTKWRDKKWKKIYLGWTSRMITCKTIMNWDFRKDLSPFQEGKEKKILVKEIQNQYIGRRTQEKIWITYSYKREQNPWNEIETNVPFPYTL